MSTIVGIAIAGGVLYWSLNWRNMWPFRGDGRTPRDVSRLVPDPTGRPGQNS